MTSGGELEGRSAVILAGGLSRRMGFPKAKLAHDGVLVISEMFNKLSLNGWDKIAIVISQPELRKINESIEIETLFNPHPERGMISSLRLALDWADTETSGLLAWPVDHPLVSEMTLGVIRNAITADNIVVPTFKGRRGHPTWWGEAAWRMLRSELADKGARAVIRSGEVPVREVAVEDAHILTNVDTPEMAARYNLYEFNGK